MPPTNAPLVLVYVTVPQLSVAIGATACAAAKPAASSHCNVTSSEPGDVVHTGAVLSTILIVAGDAAQAAMILPVPASVTSQSAAIT